MVKALFSLLMVILTVPTFMSFFGEIKPSGDVTFFNSWSAKPLMCRFKNKTGVPCASCGLTRGWISISHGKLDQAYTFNKNSLKTYLVWNLIVLITFSFVLIGKLTKKKVALALLTSTLLFSYGWHEIVEENFTLYRMHGLI